MLNFFAKLQLEVSSNFFSNYNGFWNFHSRWDASCNFMTTVLN